jgi:threonine-phosphate decarboxylase
MHGGDIFAVARANGWDWREVLDFSANINPLGLSPRVRPAVCEALDRIVHYPEREPSRLKAALAKEWRLDVDQLLLGNGATELIFFLSRVLAPERVTLALPVFSEFHRAFPAAQTADLTDPGTWAQGGLLVLTRPANPTGCSISLETLQSHLNASSGLVLVDESFLEFSGLPSVATLMEQYPQLMVLRSLTKFYALPGLRIGALISTADRGRSWKERRSPWQVNVLAEEAALAAIGDREHASRSVEFVQSERAWLCEQLGSLPYVKPLPATANFIFVRLGYPAAPLCEYLQRLKILIRNCAGWPGIEGHAVRVAVRRRDENQQLIEAWRTFTCD